jgi:hypothetical protein
MNYPPVITIFIGQTIPEWVVDCFNHTRSSNWSNSQIGQIVCQKPFPPEVLNPLGLGVPYI